MNHESISRRESAKECLFAIGQSPSLLEIGLNPAQN